jgi:TatD DNase family protein
VHLYDAHNHLHDDRLGPAKASLIHSATQEGVVRMVVNGSCEEDWPAVLTLAKAHPAVVLPSFGYHPWYVKERTVDWRPNLIHYLDQVPSAVGEIGLDRWIKDHDLAQQEEVFQSQLQIATDRNLPISIHCLKAWGRLFDLLRGGPTPRPGFLLHSYGGPQEMVEPLAKLGAYFSFPGYYAHERKHRQRETFRHVPLDRLLIETDAPDQLLPDSLTTHQLIDPASGNPINHPANLGAVYQFVAELIDIPLAELAGQVEANFKRLFGPVATR